MVAWKSPPRRLVILALVAGALLAWPVASGASGALTVQRVRLGDHPAFVRAVADFGGGTLAGAAVEATDPNPFDGTAQVQVAHAHVGATGLRRVGLGVVVRVVQRRTSVQIVVTSRRARFKYLSYAVVGGRRLAIDLWKSAPPSPAATIRVGAHRCLTLDRIGVRPGSVSASGREHALFEHQLAVVLRGRDGSVLGRRHVRAAGRWSARVGYRVHARQRGTIEAVALSPKDGALACIVQAPVTLPAFP